MGECGLPDSHLCFDGKEQVAMKSQRIQGFCEGGYLPAETWRMREGSQAGRVCAIQPSGAYSRKTSLCDPRGKSLTPRRGQGER